MNEWWGAPPPVIIACYVSGSERVERFRERIFWYLVRILYYFWHVAECEEKCLLVTFFTFPLGLPLALHWRCSYFEGNKENDIKVGIENQYEAFFVTVLFFLSSFSRSTAWQQLQRLKHYISQAGSVPVRAMLPDFLWVGSQAYFHFARPPLPTQPWTLDCWATMS